MLRPSVANEGSDPRGLRFGIVAARYNADLADALLDACVKSLQGARAIEVVRVPGSFEVPAAVARLARRRRYDCLIALGVLLQGETKHADLIGHAVAWGLTQISITADVPVVFGIVTANNLRQARVRCLSGKYNRGREAAQTAIAMARLWKRR